MEQEAEITTDKTIGTPMDFFLKKIITKNKESLMAISIISIIRNSCAFIFIRILIIVYRLFRLKAYRWLYRSLRNPFVMVFYFLKIFEKKNTHHRQIAQNIIFTCRLPRWDL